MKRALLAVLFLLALGERVVFDLGPNIELITMAMLIASAYFGRKEALWLTFLLMLTSDLIIGNTNIFLFTWSGFLIPALFAGNLFSNKKFKRVKKVGFGTFLGAGANMFFFLWTNFGVWALDTFGMYPKTLGGLMMSYINAIPFWRNQLLSTLIFVTLGFTISELALHFSPTLKARLKKPSLV